MPVVKRKEHPLSMRLPEADLAVIDRAAARRGWSRTAFVRDAAVRAAEATLMEPMLIRMTDEGFAHFLEEISKPGEPVPEMVRDLGRVPPWEQPQDS